MSMAQKLIGGIVKMRETTTITTPSNARISRSASEVGVCSTMPAFYRTIPYYALHFFALLAIRVDVIEVDSHLWTQLNHTI